MLKSQLDYIIELTLQLRDTNSSLQKKEILASFYNKDNALFTKWMDYIYSFDKKYWISSNNILKLWDSLAKVKYTFQDNDDIFLVLNKIINRELTGHNAINYMINLINFLADKKYQDILFCVVNKDLKANVNISLINKIVVCIKEFKVALAHRFDEANEIESHKVDFADGTWQVSRKLDGVRTIAMSNNNVIEFYSRTGGIFSTLNNLVDQVTKILHAASADGHEYVLDGEVCLLDKDDKDNFAGIMQEITKKNHTIENPSYIIFDLIEKTEFLEANGTTQFIERIEKLEKLDISQYGKYCKMVPNKKSIDVNDFNQWQDICEKNNWEGLILRKQTALYNGKRTFDLLKFKKFFDAEFTVIDTEVGTKKMLVEGKMEERECVKAVIIDFKGNKVGVGSGLSDKQRIDWLHDKSLIIGKLVNIQYFEESIDTKTNLPSLRFPTLKYIYDEKERKT